MAKLIAYGIYLPKYRINDTVLDPVHARKPGMRSVVYTDEDVLTMAYAAGRQCLEKAGQPAAGAILFATTSPVFSGRYHASYLADWLELPQGIPALDLASTSRSGTDALWLANQWIDSGLCDSCLVLAADCHFPEHGEELAKRYGHAACAILLGRAGDLARIHQAFSFSHSFSEGFWYKDCEINYDSRFSRDKGPKASLAFALVNSLSDTKAAPGEKDKLILSGTSARTVGSLLAKAGLDSEKQLRPDLLTGAIGHAGCAHALLQLVSALDTPGQKNWLFDYANGANVIEFETLQAASPDWETLLAATQELKTYQEYLAIRKVNTGDGFKGVSMFQSEMMEEREKPTLYHLQGNKCKKCGTVYYLKAMRCKNCHGQEFEPVRLGRKGQVYTFTEEHYYPATFPPVHMLVVDLEGGGRMTVQQTDNLYEHPLNGELIGQSGELVLRKMVEGDRYPNYFWKFRLETDKTTA